MNGSNKKLLIIAAVVAVIVGVVFYSIQGSNAGIDIATAGKAKYTYVGDKECADCQTSFKYLQQVFANSDVIVEFVDQGTEAGRVPNIPGANNEGAVINTCEAGDHINLIREGGQHFASVEEAAAAVGSAAGGQQEITKLYIDYGSDGCDDCQVVAEAFAAYSQQYSPESVEFRVVDVNADPEAASEAGLTGAHMIAAHDEDGCTGVRDGIPGADKDEILQTLQALQVAPGGYTNP